MGANGSIMTNHDTNDHSSDRLLKDTEPETKQKHGRAERDSIQSFYSSNEYPGKHDDEDSSDDHSPVINHEAAAWSPLLQKRAGPLEEPFSSFSEVCPEPQLSGCLDGPFSMPERREYPAKPLVSGRLDGPFDEAPEMDFASPDASSPSYNNASTPWSRKGGKYRPESSTSLSSKLTREIKNFNKHEPAPSLRSPINPDRGDVPLPLNTGGKHSTGSRLTKKNNLESNMNPPSRLGPRLRMAPQPRPVPEPTSQKPKPRKYLSKKPLPLSLSDSFLKSSGSGSGYDAAGVDISSLSGELPLVDRPRPLTTKQSGYCQGSSKEYDRSTDHKLLFQQPNQQQQLRRAGDSPRSPVSPLSPSQQPNQQQQLRRAEDYPPSPVSLLPSIDNPRDLGQQKEKSTVVPSQRQDKPVLKLKIPKQSSIEPQLDSPAGNTTAERGQEHLTARFEFNLEIPVGPDRFSKPDIPPIEECLLIRTFELRAFDKDTRVKHDLEYTKPSFCYRMNETKTAKPTNNDEADDSGNTQQTVRYYGFVKDLAFPPNMTECKMSAALEVGCSPETTSQVTLDEWVVDVSRFQCRQQ